jgi:hypothetical protein
MTVEERQTISTGILLLAALAQTRDPAVAHARLNARWIETERFGNDCRRDCKRAVLEFDVHVMAHGIR